MAASGPSPSYTSGGGLTPSNMVRYGFLHTRVRAVGGLSVQLTGRCGQTATRLRVALWPFHHAQGCPGLVITVRGWPQGRVPPNFKNVLRALLLAGSVFFGEHVPKAHQ